jgi:homoserine O-acetyltransferase
MKFRPSLLAALICLVGTSSRAADVPKPTEGDFAIPAFQFRSGEVLPSLRIHYRTLGTPTVINGVTRNAVLVMHGTTGDGNQFFRPSFAGELFGPGQPLDASRYFLIFPDDIGHGKSSKPSDGLHGRFPAYRYADMVDAEHRLVVDGLHVNHLRLVMGTSMGGMHTWMWGETYPAEMDALMPLASEPVEIGGRNRMWRRMAADAIREDPAWNHGDYMTQPHGLKMAAQLLYLVGSNPAKQTERYPTGDAAIKAVEAYGDRALQRMDANDVLYAVESSLDYNPRPRLGDIRAPLVAVNSADDLINPPDQGLLEREIGRVAHGRAVIIPEGPDTDGHGTHTIAKVWKGELERLLRETEPSSSTFDPAPIPHR